MIKTSAYFTYAGIKSKDKHIINVSIDGGMAKEPFLASRNIKETIIRGREKPYFLQTKAQPLQFQLILTLDDEDLLWTEDKLRGVARWLDQRNYQPLIFEDSPNLVYYCMPTESLEITHNCLRQGYIELTMKCDSPYAYSPYILLPEPNGQNVAIEVNGTKTIEINNKGDKDCYPEIWIEKTNSNGKVEIINNTNRSNCVFQEGEKSEGTLTFTGGALNGETISIGNDVYEFDTGDGKVDYNTRIKVDVSSDAAFAQSKLIFDNHNNLNNPAVVDSETITIADKTYEFDNDGIYSSANIPVNIADAEDYSKGKLNLSTNPFNGESITIGKQTYQFIGDVTETQIMTLNHDLEKVGLENSTQFLYAYNKNKKQCRIAQIIDKNNIQLRYFNISSDGYVTSTEEQEKQFLLGLLFNDNNLISKKYPIVPISFQNISDVISINKIDNNNHANIIRNGQIIEKDLNMYADLIPTLDLCHDNVLVYQLKNVPISYNNLTIIPKIDDVLFCSYCLNIQNIKPYFYRITEVKADYAGGQGDNMNVNIILTLDNNIPLEYKTNADKMSLVFLSKVKDIVVDKSKFTSSNQIKIGNTKEETLQNIVYTINGNENYIGSNYSQGTISQDDILIANVDSINKNIMNLQYKKKGYIGNSILTLLNMYDGNNRFEDSQGRGGVTALYGGHSCELSVALSKLANTINNNLDSNSLIQPTVISGNSLIVKAKIAGSDGNNILTTSNCACAKWDTSYNRGFTLANGKDPSISACVNALKNAINSGNRLYTIIPNINPNVIEIQYKTIGEEGNVPVNSTCYNAYWDNITLDYGRSELQVGETVYINNARHEIVSSLEPQGIYRNQVHNGEFLKLIRGKNNIKINGNCKIRFKYRYILLQN